MNHLVFTTRISLNEGSLEQVFYFNIVNYIVRINSIILFNYQNIQLNQFFCMENRNCAPSILFVMRFCCLFSCMHNFYTCMISINVDFHTVFCVKYYLFVLSIKNWNCIETLWCNSRICIHKKVHCYFLALHKFCFLT